MAAMLLLNVVVDVCKKVLVVVVVCCRRRRSESECVTGVVSRNQDTLTPSPCSHSPWANLPTVTLLNYLLLLTK